MDSWKKGILKTPSFTKIQRSKSVRSTSTRPGYLIRKAFLNLYWYFTQTLSTPIASPKWGKILALKGSSLRNAIYLLDAQYSLHILHRQRAALAICQQSGSFDNVFNLTTINVQLR